MDLPEELGGFQYELAGRLAMAVEAGPEIRALRDKYGFTQEGLAGLLGMRRESLSRIESGHVRPSTTFIQRFTRIMTLAYAARLRAAATDRPGATIQATDFEAVREALALDVDAAHEVVESSIRSYERKKRVILQGLELEGRR